MKSHEPTPLRALLIAGLVIAAAGAGGIYAMTLADRGRTATRASTTVVVVVPRTGVRLNTSTPPPTFGLTVTAVQPLVTPTEGPSPEPGSTGVQPLPSPLVTSTGAPTALATPSTGVQPLQSPHPQGPVGGRLTLNAPTASPTSTSTPSNTPTASPTPLVIPYPNGLGDAYLPQVSDRARALYAYGISHGNDPRVFARLGDCHSSYPGFLGTFDTPTAYRLGDYAYLRETIDYFSGSFSHPSQTGYSGLHMGSFFSPLWADPQVCSGSENVMECEYRLRHPSIIFVNVGTLNMNSPDEQYESFLRRIVEFWLGKSVLPILNTKADDIEGGGRFNQIVRRLAAEYDIPLWDFWIAAQTLPDQGLQGDRVHLSDGQPYFDDPGQLQSGWTLRNLTGLQALDLVRRKLLGAP